MSPLVIRDIPGFVVYFASYEILLDILSAPESRGNVGPLAPIIAGGLAGMISWTSTFPCDVVKSKMQADGSDGKYLYKGFTDCLIKSYRTGGFRGFFTGLGPTLLRAFPTNGIIFFVYDLVSKFLSEKTATTGKSLKIKAEPDWNLKCTWLESMWCTYSYQCEKRSGNLLRGFEKAKCLKENRVFCRRLLYTVGWATQTINMGEVSQGRTD